MSDFDFPDLPSDDELGITDEDREQFEQDLADDATGASDPELKTLLGDTPAKPGGGAQTGASGDGQGSQKEPAAASTAGGRDDAVRRKWRGPLTLLALLLISAFASTRTGLPKPVPANGPDSVFSSSRAMSTLVEMVRRAHPTGSPEHAWVPRLVLERRRYETSWA